MALNLVKGQKVELNKDVQEFKIGLGWDISAQAGKTFDLDAMALIVNNDGKADDSDLVYYGALKHKSGAVIHSGDNLTGEGDGDDEVITIIPSKLPADAKEVIIFVNIYQGTIRSQNFGQVRNAKVTLYEGSNAAPTMTYDLEEDASTGVCLNFVRIYKHNDVWKISATGETSNDDTHAFLAKFK